MEAMNGMVQQAEENERSLHVQISAGGAGSPRQLGSPIDSEAPLTKLRRKWEEVVDEQGRLLEEALYIV